MGWMGWSEEQALRSDVNAIQVAYEGRCDMLKAIFGGEDDDEPRTGDKAGPPMTPELFDAMFGG
jgi:hypothetical protein